MVLRLALTGVGILIGQVEDSRPGILGAGKDDTVNSNLEVKPTAVYFQDGAAVWKLGVGEHATGVAGLMIADGAT